MVRIRLRRTGKKNQASFRVVVADSEAPRDGRFIENIGFYNPRTDPPTIEIQADRARYWLSQGAQPSEPAARLLRKIGVLPEIDYKTGEPVEASAEPVTEPEAAVEPTLSAEPAPQQDPLPVEQAPEAVVLTASPAPAEEETNGGICPLAAMLSLGAVAIVLARRRSSQ